MRRILTLAAIAALLVISARAEEPAIRKQAAPTDKAIIGIRGSAFAKVFAQFGLPGDITAVRRSTRSKDGVLLDYGAFGFLVRHKVVDACFFWSDWKGSIRGIKMGDSRENVVKVLGSKPRYTIRDKDNAITAYGYDLKGSDVCYFANFDDHGKLDKVEIAPP